MCELAFILSQVFTRFLLIPIIFFLSEENINITVLLPESCSKWSNQGNTKLNFAQNWRLIIHVCVSHQLIFVFLIHFI